MPLSRAFLQTLGATVLLAVALGCKGRSSGPVEPKVTSISISGTVTYLRVPLAKDSSGIPMGLADSTLATNLQSLPARGVVVRVYQKVEQIQPDGVTKNFVWLRAGSGLTDSVGNYNIAVPKDRFTMVEVLSTFNGGGSQVISLIGEPTGINSTTPVLDRLQFAMRKASDGATPVNTPVPNAMLTANSVVNFSIGLNDVWWLVNPSYNLTTSAAPGVELAILETDMLNRTSGLGSGSRILGIGDSIASFISIYGAATPGAALDLHYWPSLSEPQGSFIQYERNKYPHAFDNSTGTFHYFGSLRGDSSNDDAWDEGVLFPLLARNVLFGENQGRTYSISGNPLFPTGISQFDLSPDIALIEGLADAMAANALRCPFLADTNGTSLANPNRDIRDLTGIGISQLNPYSAPGLRSLAWEIVLKANNLPSPGSVSDWNSINPLATSRFFHVPPSPTNGLSGTAARDIEPINIYSHLNRLKESKSTNEPADLAAIFTDSVLIQLAPPFGIPWPRPTVGDFAIFVSDWGIDPNALVTSLNPVTFSMASANQINGAYPNVSRGEVYYSGFSLNTDKRYILTATISPALTGTDAEILWDIPRMNQTFSFKGSGESKGPIVIPMPSATPPVYHPIRIRLRSTATLQPDVTVSLSMTPVP